MSVSNEYDKQVTATCTFYPKAYIEKKSPGHPGGPRDIVGYVDDASFGTDNEEYGLVLGQNTCHYVISGIERECKEALLDWSDSDFPIFVAGWIRRSFVEVIAEAKIDNSVPSMAKRSLEVASFALALGMAESYDRLATLPSPEEPVDSTIALGPAFGFKNLHTAWVFVVNGCIRPKQMVQNS